MCSGKEIKSQVSEIRLGGFVLWGCPQAVHLGDSSQTVLKKSEHERKNDLISGHF
jgi:hypothetical protein